MSLWQVRTQGANINLGGTLRPLKNPNGCNQPFMGRYWCPKKRWFRGEPCPFVNRRECDNFNRLCGCA
jgi:hypothetical protein